MRIAIVSAVAAVVAPGLLSAQVFGIPTAFTAAGSNASWPSFAEGGLALYYNHDVVNGQDGKIFVIRRPSLDGAWGQAQVVYDSQPVALGPRVSPDGLELFGYAWAGGFRQIHRSSRANLGQMFPPLQPVTDLAASQHRGPGSLSADGLTLYFWDWSTSSGGWYATRPARGQLFTDRGPISGGAIGWVSEDERVGFSWGMHLLRRQTTAELFGLSRSAGPVTDPLTGAPTFLPSTGELIYWADNGQGRHRLMISMRRDTLVDYSDARLGGQIDLDIYGRPVELWVLAVGTETQNVPFPPFGTLLVGGVILAAGIGAIPSQGLVWSPVLDPFPARYQVHIPQDPTLVNATLHWQALTADRVLLARGSLTNLVSTTISAQ